MLKLNRVCVSLGMKCNLQCKYCYRDMEKINDNVLKFNDLMYSYLEQLDNKYTEAVCASGGEPLIYWDKILDMFSHVPKNVHKKIMTNGLLLTQDKINYINDNNIEVHISHDGDKTEFLRGKDFMKDENILNLVRQIKQLRVNCVVTSFNNNPLENYYQTIKVLKREDIYYTAGAILDIPQQDYLIKNFDYKLFMKKYIELSKIIIRSPFYANKSLDRTYKKNGICGLKDIFAGINVLPNGTLCGMRPINSYYGTVMDTEETVYQNMLKSGDFNKCINCKILADCHGEARASEHICKIRKLFYISEHNKL